MLCLVVGTNKLTFQLVSIIFLNWFPLNYCSKFMVLIYLVLWSGQLNLCFTDNIQFIFPLIDKHPLNRLLSPYLATSILRKYLNCKLLGTLCVGEKKEREENS